jgi:uncharacterized protein
MNRPFQNFVLVVLLSLAAVMPAAAQAPSGREKELATYRAQLWQKPPAHNNWVNDFEGILSTVEEQRLNASISDYENHTGIEIAVVTIDTMMVSAARFDSFALHLFNTWGVGKKGLNNGVLVCISKGYRKIRVCNGYGISARLSDSQTQKIVDESFIPGFKEGAYAKGLETGLNRIMKVLE